MATKSLGIFSVNPLRSFMTWRYSIIPRRHQRGIESYEIIEGMFGFSVGRLQLMHILFDVRTRRSSVKSREM